MHHQPRLGAHDRSGQRDLHQRSLWDLRMGSDGIDAGKVYLSCVQPRQRKRLLH